MDIADGEFIHLLTTEDGRTDRRDAAGNVAEAQGRPRSDGERLLTHEVLDRALTAPNTQTEAINLSTPTLQEAARLFQLAGGNQRNPSSETKHRVVSL